MIPTVNLTGTIYDLTGTAVAGAKVKIKLTAIDLYQHQYVYPQEQTYTTDVNGQFTAALFPNAIGELNTTYQVRAQDSTQSKTYLNTTMVVPNHATTLDAIAGTGAQDVSKAWVPGPKAIPFLDQTETYVSFMKNYNTSIRNYIFPDVSGTVAILQGALSAGIMTSDAAGVVTSRTIVGTANQVNVANGDGSGNPTLSLPQNIHTAATPTFAGMTLASGSIAASAPALNVTQTWNNAGVTFVGNDTNITDSASNAASLIERWRVGGSVMASINKLGAMVLAAGLTLTGGLAGATTGSFSGQITSTVATGTAPLVVASTTNVANLNASFLNGATFAAPGAIGSGTPGTGAFTTLSTTGALTYGGVTLNNAVTGTGNMVLSAGPTLTGTLTAAAANFSGTVAPAGLLNLSGVNFIHQLSGHAWVQGDATNTYNYGGTSGWHLRKSDNSVGLLDITDAGAATLLTSLEITGSNGARSLLIKTGGLISYYDSTNAEQGRTQATAAGGLTFTTAGLGADKLAFTSNAITFTGNTVFSACVGINGTANTSNYALSIDQAVANGRNIMINNTVASGTAYGIVVVANSGAATNKYAYYANVSGSTNNYAFYSDGGLIIFNGANAAVSGVANMQIATTDAQAIDKGGMIGLAGLADVTVNFATVSGRKENSTGNNRSGYFGVSTYLDGTGHVEHFRVNSAGYSKHSTGAYLSATGQYHEFIKTEDHGDFAVKIKHSGATATNQYGAQIILAGDPNDTTRQFFTCVGNATERATMRSNGGLANFSANNVNLSDLIVKPSFELYSVINLMPSLWDAHKAMRGAWGRYKYDDQTHDDWNYGYGAQLVRQAFAGVADEIVGAWSDKSKLLAVYQEDLHNITGAIVTEAQFRIDDHEQRLQKLEASIH